MAQKESKGGGGEGLVIIRVKPLGAGGGGVEASGGGLENGKGSLRYGDGTVQVLSQIPKTYTYARDVIRPEMDNAALYASMMPSRVDAFLSGVNVNIMAYGQTGTGFVDAFLAATAAGCHSHSSAWGVWARGGNAAPSSANSASCSFPHAAGRRTPCSAPQASMGWSPVLVSSSHGRGCEVSSGNSRLVTHD